MTGAVRTIGTLLSRATDVVSRDASPESADGAPTDEGEPEEESSIPILSCTGCRRTYLGETVSTCSECGSDVEQVPDEYELGLV